MENSTYNRGLVRKQLTAQHLHHKYNSFVGDRRHRLHNNGQRHRPHAQQEVFCTISSVQQVLLTSGGATSGMGISKVQQQKWITTEQHNEFNIDTEKNNELHDIVDNKVRYQDMESTSSTRSSVRRFVFNLGVDIYIVIIKMDKKSNTHRQH